jgi:hypothetical protein
MKPSTIKEAVAAIQAAFPEAELRAWAQQPEETACSKAHFKLGMWIRNNWIYGSGSPLATGIREAHLFVQDDKISSLIIRALWRVMNGFPCPSVEEL